MRGFIGLDLILKVVFTLLVLGVVALAALKILGVV